MGGVDLKDQLLVTFLTEWKCMDEVVYKNVLQADQQCSNKCYDCIIQIKYRESKRPVIL
jgi:hypothetical protein